MTYDERTNSKTNSERLSENYERDSRFLRAK